MKKNSGPFPSPGFPKQIAGINLPPLILVGSGEVTANVVGSPMGAHIVGGIVKDVWLAVGTDGEAEHGQSLQLSGEVFINGTSCLSTLPVLYSDHSGEAASQNSTESSGTGVQQAVIDPDNRTFQPGDLFTADLRVTRTSPDAEIINSVIVVEVEPFK